MRQLNGIQGKSSIRSKIARIRTNERLEILHRSLLFSLPVSYLAAHSPARSFLKFLNFEYSFLSEEAEALRKKDVKIIIALGHSGYEVDQRIAKSCPLVDVVIGGHSNTFLYNGAQPDVEEIEGPYPTVITQESGKQVPVVQAFAYTKYMGELRLSVSTLIDLC